MCVTITNQITYKSPSPAYSSYESFLADFTAVQKRIEALEAELDFVASRPVSRWYLDNEDAINRVQEQLDDAKAFYHYLDTADEETLFKENV